MCRKEYKKQYREDNTEYVRQYHKQWEENNKEHRKQVSKQWREANPGHHKTWRVKNPERYKEKVKKWQINVMKNSTSTKAYTDLHKYMRKIKETPLYCTICNEIKPLEICSIDHEYTENPKDWIYLCVKCHRLFDQCRKDNKKLIFEKCVFQF